MSAGNAPSGQKTRVLPYGDFRGIETARDATALESGRAQYLTGLDNGYCDLRGQIVRDPTRTKRVGERPVEHIRFYARNHLTWAERYDAGIELRSEAGHRSGIVFTPNSILSTAVFNRNVIAISLDQAGWYYDGLQWREAPGPLRDLGAAFAITAQRRLCVAGIPSLETQVHISRVDRLDVMPHNEDPASFSALRAGIIDIANVLQSADVITGLGVWEQNRLCIFTSDRCILYTIDFDINQWAIDDRANIQVGTESHASICSAGGNLLLASRSGVHSLRRTMAGDTLVFSVPLSEKISILYRRLYQSVDNPQSISGVWDQDEAQYHLFFPQRGGELCTRLTLTLNLFDESITNWSTGTFLNARCGAFLAGQLVLGTNTGLYDVNKLESEAGEAPTLDATTPILWHGNVVDTKDALKLIIRASGKGLLEITAHDEQGRPFYARELEVDADDDGSYPDIPLARQYELPFAHRYKGVQFRLRCKGVGPLRILGLAVVLRSS